MTIAHQLFLQSLRDVAKLGAAARAAYRLDLLERLVRQAGEMLAPQRARLACCLGPAGFDLDRWPLVPPVTLEDPSAAPSTSLPGIADACLREFVAELHELDLTTPLAELADTRGEVEHGRGWGVTFPRTPHHKVSLRLDPAAQAAALTELGAPYLRGPGAALAHIVGSGARLPDVEAVWIDGPAPRPEDLATLRRAFGRDPIVTLSRPALGVFAHSVPGAPDLAVAAATHWVEVVGAAGAPVAVGSPGRVLVTAFYDHARAPLRVASGDVAVALDDAGPPLPGPLRIALRSV